jgi:3-carboxy-cis,cis-muconate cycloisomerase
MELLDPLFRSEDVEGDFSSQRCLQAMLDFEAALARAESRAGVIPYAAAAAIAGKCKAELFDQKAIARGAALAGNLAIPLVKALTALVAQENKEAASYVHWGATSQDVIDTGLVLQLRHSLTRIGTDLALLASGLAELAIKYRSTVMAGRTWMQQAVPTTFGAKVAGWLDAVDRQRERLGQTERRSLVLQFGGAVGTLGALNERGSEVAKLLAEELRLPLPEIPWHTYRDRMAEIATTLGLCVGTMGKIARDIALHGQTEIAEVLEPATEGRGGSSTMPHKRNPITSAVVLAAAVRVPGLVSTMLTAMVQEQERGLGGWHAEWETLPQIVRLTAGTAHHLAETAPRLEIDSNRMLQNLEVTRGLIYAEAIAMALAPDIGKAQAHALVEEACRQAQKDGRHLREVLGERRDVHDHLPPEALGALFDPRRYLGMAEEFVDRVVAASSAMNQADHVSKGKQPR